jgi:hypothetical protein
MVLACALRLHARPLPDVALTKPGFSSGSEDTALSFGEARPFPRLNALFESKEGWIGADGAYSVDLDGQRRLWLFSDTWVGQVRGGRRVKATIVNNSIGVQESNGEMSKLHFAIGKSADQKPAAIFTPSDGSGWFWLQAGIVQDKNLFIFLAQIEKTDKPGVFGFRRIGQWLGIVSNPNDDPTRWRCRLLKLPCSAFSPEREMAFGVAVVRDNDYLYVYGTDEDVLPTSRDRYLIVARVLISDLRGFAAWRFYDGHGWSTDFRASKRMVSQMASEGSVSYLVDRKQYVLVYTEGGLSDRILARTAPEPSGPWSPPSVIYRCPEPARDKRMFCYGAKAHPSLGNGHDLLVSYVANSFDFWQVASDANIYRPRFIRVPVR